MLCEAEKACSSTVTKTKVSMQAVVDLVEKEVNAIVKVFNKKTQYSVLDFDPEQVERHTEKKQLLLVKIPTRKCCNGQDCNTSLSFSPNAIVTMAVSPKKVADEEIEDDPMSEIPENDIHDASFKVDDDKEAEYDVNEEKEKVESDFTGQFT